MRWASGVALFLVACSGPEGAAVLPSDDVALEARECSIESVIVLEDLDQVPEGFVRSPAELVSLVTGTFSGDVEVGEGLEEADEVGAARVGDVQGTFVVDERVGEVRLVEAVWTDTGAPCDRWYELTFTAGLRTGDGTLDEVFAAEMMAGPDELPTFEAALPASLLRGSLEPEGLDPATTDLRVTGAFDTDAWAGRFAWRVRDAEGTWEDDLGSFWFGGP